MRRQLEGGERVRVRKAMHVLDARQRLVPVYIVESDAGETLVLGDGEIVAKLPPGVR